MIRLLLGVEHFQHMGCDKERNIWKFVLVVQLSHQFSAGSRSLSNWKVEVRVLLSIGHLVIKEQHDEPWIKPQKFGIMCHRPTPQQSQPWKQGTGDVTTICDPVRSSPIPEQTRPETSPVAIGNAGSSDSEPRMLRRLSEFRGFVHNQAFQFVKRIEHGKREATEKMEKQWRRWRRCRRIEDVVTQISRN